MRSLTCPHALLCGTAVLVVVIPSIVAGEVVDVETIGRIRAEESQHSQVMAIASWLADVYGSRLTGSRSLKAAADWAVTTLQSWGLSDVHLEPWGPYDSGLASEQWGPQDRGWSNEKFEFRAVEPRHFTIHALPAAWSPGTRGCVRGDAVRFDVHSF